MKKLVLLLILTISALVLVGSNSVSARMPIEIVDDPGGGGTVTDTCNISTIKTINLGTIKHCEFETLNDVDYVIFRTSFSETYTININVDDSSNFDYVNLYNHETGAFIQSRYSDGSFQVNLSRNTEYKLVIKGDNDNYTVQINGVDTCNTKSLSLNNITYCAFDGNSTTYDKDIFTFNTSSSYDYYVDVDADVTNNFDTIRVFNQYGAVILEENSEGIHAVNLQAYSSNTIHLIGESSDYDIKVYPRVDDCSDYQSGAVSLTLDSSRSCTIQVKSTGSDSDFLKFTPTDTGVHKITFRHSTLGSFRTMEVYDSEGNQVPVDIESSYFYGELTYYGYVYTEKNETYTVKITGSTHNSSFSVKYSKEMVISNTSWVDNKMYPQSDIMRTFDSTGEDFDFTEITWELNEFQYTDTFTLGYYKYTFYNTLMNKYVTYYYDWIVYEYVNPDTPNQVSFGIEYLHADVYTYDPITKTLNWQGHAQPTSGDMSAIEIEYLSQARISYFAIDDNASANATSKNIGEAFVGFGKDKIIEYFSGDFESHMNKVTDFYLKYFTHGDNYDYETLGFTLYFDFELSNGQYPIGQNVNLYTVALSYEDNYYMKLKESYVLPGDSYNLRTAASKLTVTSTDQNPYYSISLKIELDNKTGHDYVVFEIDSEGNESVTTE